MMPPLLFLVATDTEVIYYAPGILELFRLRAVYNPPDDAKVYRYIKGREYNDRRFTWDKDKKWWVIGNSISFGLTSFSALEAGYKMMGGK